MKAPGPPRDVGPDRLARTRSQIVSIARATAPRSASGTRTELQGSCGRRSAPIRTRRARGGGARPRRGRARDEPGLLLLWTDVASRSSSRMPRRTPWRPRTEERLRAATAVGRVGSVPDERLRCDIEIARPGHRSVSGPDSAEACVVGAQPLENGTPQKVLDVALDDRDVGCGSGFPQCESASPPP